MDTIKAICIIKALDTIGDALGMTPNQVGAFACSYDQKKMDVLNEAATIYNKFQDASIVERGRMLGITITET